MHRCVLDWSQLKGTLEWTVLSNNTTNGNVCIWPDTVCDFKWLLVFVCEGRCAATL